MKIEATPYGRLPAGRPVNLYTLTNDRGMRVRLTDYGALTVSVEAPDRGGRPADVTLGYDSLAGWLGNGPYFGATIGRCANRIAGAEFTLDGRVYRLAANSGRHHLHGGRRGFDKVLWEAAVLEEPDAVGVKFGYTSPDGEEGYPGELRVTAEYRLTGRNEFRAEFSAVADRPTIVNLAHHTYWNLAGPAAGDVLGHELELAADRYTVADAELIPTGEIRSVQGTPLDFTRPAAIGARIARLPGGYDVNFVLREAGGGVRLAARVREPRTGRVLEVHTDQPGIQLYTGNFLDGSITGKGGVAYRRHAGLCLETQGFPDAPHHAHFPSIVLRPGQTYRHTMVHVFRAE